LSSLLSFNTKHLVQESCLTWRCEKPGYCRRNVVHNDSQQYLNGWSVFDVATAQGKR